MTRSTGLAIRLACFAAAMVVLLITVLQAMDRPLTGGLFSYTAVFTDANGLKPGDDVRLYGVRIGTVRTIELASEHTAAVAFEVERDKRLFRNGMFAIRYQNLTGQRYVDVQPPATPDGTLSDGAVVGTDRTIPSFDVTTLFNGLRPVLAELTPEDLNRLATSLLAVIEGNGTGLGPALDAIEKLSRYVADRQSVISALVANLGAINDHLGGKSGNVVALMSQLTDVFVTLQQRIDGLVDFALTIPPVLEPVNQMLVTLGLTPRTNTDLDRVIKLLFPDPEQFADVMNRVPVFLQTLSKQLPGVRAGDMPVCSRGDAEVPQPLTILLDGKRVKVCRS